MLAFLAQSTQRANHERLADVRLLPAPTSIAGRLFPLRPRSQPLEIYVDDETKLTLHGLQQHYVKMQEAAKNRKLNDLLDSLEFNQVCIFVKSVNRATQLDALLRDCNFPSICIHSGLPQAERIKKYQQFKAFEKRILVATDIFGRGIDVERVNSECPPSSTLECDA